MYTTMVWISPAYFSAFESENFISELNLNKTEKAKILSVSDFLKGNFEQSIFYWSDADWPKIKWLRKFGGQNHFLALLYFFSVYI